MATIPQLIPAKRSDKELSEELHSLIEECFNDMDLSQSERNARYAALDRSLDAKDVARAKSSESL